MQAPPSPDPRWLAYVTDALDTYEREALAQGRAPAAAGLHFAMGRIWEERLGDPRAAAQCYQNAHQLDPSHLPTLRAARRLFSGAGHREAALALCELELAATATPQARAEALREKGALLVMVGRPDAARAAFEEGLVANPQHPGLTADLGELLDQAGDAAARAALHEHTAAQLADPQLANVHRLAAAALFEDRLGDAGRALADFQAAHDTDPANLAALAGMERFFTRTGRFEDYAVALGRSAAALPAAAAAPLRYRLARVLRERLNRPAEALTVLEQARAVSPSDVLILAELAGLHEAAGRWEELVAVQRERVAATTDPAQRGALALSLGTLLEEKLGRDDEAIAAFSEVLSLAPGHGAALAALGKLFHKKGDAGGLLTTFLSEATAATDARQKAAKLYKAGEILEERLGRTNDAIARYLEALDLSPAFVPAFRALSQCYERMEQWEELLALHERELAISPDRESTIAVLTQIANICEDRLLDPDRAMSALERILATAPDHLPTIRALARIAERTQRWKDYLKANEREAALTVDQKAIIGLLHRGAEILEEQLGEKEAAIEQYKKILALNPGYLPALRALGKLYRSQGRWAELAEMFLAEVEVDTDPGHAAILLHQMGEIYEQRLGDPAKAEAAYREVLSHAPGHVGALRALERLCQARSAWKEVADVLRAEAASAGEPAIRADLLLRAGEVLEERLDRPDLAAQAYEEALALAPDNPWAARGAVRVRSAQDNAAALAEALVRATQAGLPAPERAAVLLRLARMRADHLGDVPGAIAACEEALRAAPESPEALALLEHLALATHDALRAAEVRARLADRCADSAATAALRSAAARSLESAGAESGPILALYRHALEADPGDSRAAAALAARLGQPGDAGPEVEIAEVLLKAQDSRGGAIAEPAERAAFALVAAEACEIEVGDPARAAALYQTALAAEPANLGALRGLRRCQEALGQWAEAVDGWERDADLSKDPARVAESCARGAEIAYQRLGDRDRAARLCERALAVDALHPRASAQLGLLREESGDYVQVVEFHEQRAIALAEGPAAAEAWALAARVRRERLGDLEGARVDIGHALALEPMQPEALLLSAAMAEEAGAYAEAADAYQRRIDAGGKAEELAPAQFAAAALAMDRLGDAARAVALLRDGLQASPDDQAALERLARAAESLGDTATAADALRRLVDHEDSPAVRATHLAALAALRDRSGDAQDAAALYEKLVELRPDDLAVHKRLSELYAALGAPEQQVKALETCAALVPVDRRAEARPYAVQAGEVYDRVLKNTSRAVLAFRGAVEADPADVETRARLAELLSREPATRAAAIEEHRQVLRRDPYRLASYHALYKLFSEDKRLDAAWCVTALLHALRAGDQDEEFFYGEHRPPAGPVEDAVLTGPLVDQLLVHPMEHGPMADLLGAFGAELGRLFPVDLAARPGGKPERLRADHPLRKLTDAIAKRYGGAELDLYQDKSEPLVCTAEVTEPPSIIVGTEFTRRFKDKEQSFLVGRLLLRLVRHNLGADRLDAAALADLCAAAVRLVHEGNPGFGHRDDELLKRLSRALSRKARKALEEPAGRVRASSPPDFTVFAQAMRWTADRAGFIACGDVGTALQMALKPEPVPATRAMTTDELIGQMRGSRAVAELLAFAVSEDYFRVRESLGMALV